MLTILTKLQDIIRANIIIDYKTADSLVKIIFYSGLSYKEYLLKEMNQE